MAGQRIAVLVDRIHSYSAEAGDETEEGEHRPAPPETSLGLLQGLYCEESLDLELVTILTLIHSSNTYLHKFMYVPTHS